MKRKTFIKQFSMAVPPLVAAGKSNFFSLPAFNGEIIEKGPFKPSWESLMQYEVPDWFRNAKFGIWAHWGPQCEPEYGDWYARGMYQEGSDQYKYHCKKYGHPSKFGFKDVVNQWKADQWDPGELVTLYKNAGARYFFALANHHDNLDLYQSKYQPLWNSLKVGPRKDIIKGWATAARKNGLPFGVSVHAAHAWIWYETAQRHDLQGPLKGVPYDGKLLKKDGAGKWWQHLDPQELYAQNHPLSENSWDDGVIHKQWDWGNGASQPSKTYINKFLNRTLDLINRYDPDILYFDDSKLPFWPINNTGLQIAAHFYNKSFKKHKSVRSVICGKILDEQQRKAIVWDIERGQANDIMPLPWQTDTCIGGWHYDKRIFENDRYKSAKTVIQALVDVVSKNGNYLLNIPVKGNGTIDEKERKIVNEIGAWMKKNSESIYGTRPWKIFGEGPALENQAKLNAQGFNEGKNKAFTHEDIRFVTKGDVLYATVLNWPPERNVLIKSLSAGAGLRNEPVKAVIWLPTGEQLTFEKNESGLRVQFPVNKDLESYAYVLKIL